MPSLGVMLAVAMAVAAAQPARAPFRLQEATIAGVHEALAAGRLTCVALTKAYLDRIEAYNLRGPALRAVIAVNPKAMDTASELDRQYKANRAGVGPLHCIPIVLKDNFDTVDMPTTGGYVGMKRSQPKADAFTVARIRQAGALILAKTNLSEFARGGMSLSSLGGQTLNPYDLTRTPGGSSGGTGAAIAANFAILGTGSDTGQSIRSPASANSLVGVRPTRGLVSRGGVIPNSQTQDEVGPIARTVTDAALLFDVMAGYDPADPVTAFGVGRVPKSYTHLLRKEALAGARIGVMTNLFGRTDRHRDVNQVMDRAVARMESLGATAVRFELPEYDALAAAVNTAPFEARAVMERYLSALGPDAPVKTVDQLIARGNSAVQKVLEEEFGIADDMNSQTYKDRMLNRDRLRLAVAGRMAALRLDAIFYPLQKILVVPVTSGDQEERNGTLSNGTGFPAVTFPVGFSSPTPSAPLGVPVGGELLGFDYSEDRLLSYAYAFEQAAGSRKPPASTPALPHEP
jgi:Asp-tRNA(Asn)/Glu-tRNA(Gln) amidotransferase A subunit family amidase